LNLTKGKNVKKILIALLFIINSFQVLANNLSDSNQLFDWAEINYPQYFSPLGQETFQIDNYLARYYENTNTYIGTLGKDVYVYGDIFGGLQKVGQIGDFVSTKVLEGLFIDSAVSGLSYETSTQSGVTDGKGTFSYQDGETVSFSVGGIPLGSAFGKSQLSPFEIATGAVDPLDFRVINVARFLQSLDDDGVPENGITITGNVKNHLTGRTIDFSLPTADFADNSEVKDIFLDLNDAGAFSRPRTLITGNTALKHLLPNILTSLGNKFTAPVGSIINFEIVSVTKTNMDLRDPDGDLDSYIRTSGDGGDHIGSWRELSGDIYTLFTLDINSDGNFALIVHTISNENKGYPTLDYAGLGFHNNPNTAAIYIQVDNKENCIDTITADLKGPNTIHTDIPLTYFPEREEWGNSPYIMPAKPKAGIWWISKIQLNCNDGSSSTFTAADPYDTYKYEGKNSDGTVDAGHTSTVTIAQDYTPPSSSTMYYIETFSNASSTGRIDPYLKVFKSPDTSHWIASNDDGARDDLGAGIIMPMTSGDTYYICVEDISGNGGAYSININQNGFTGSSSGVVNDPDAYEPDDNYLDATPIAIDSTQDHYFTSGESDCVSFTAQ
jgi:hypothetical protein